MLQLSSMLQNLMDHHSDFDLDGNDVFKNLYARMQHETLTDEDSFFQSTAKPAFTLYNERKRSRSLANRVW